MGIETMMIASMVMGMVGSVVSGVQGMEAAQDEKQQIKLQMAGENAQQAQDELNRTREFASLQADQRVGFAAAGVDPNVGTPQSLAREDRRRFTQDLTLDRALASARSRSLSNQKKAAGRRGTNALIGGFLGAASAAAGGWQDISKARQTASKTTRKAA